MLGILKSAARFFHAWYGLIEDDKGNRTERRNID